MKRNPSPYRICLIFDTIIVDLLRALGSIRRAIQELYHRNLKLVPSVKMKIYRSSISKVETWPGHGNGNTRTVAAQWILPWPRYFGTSVLRYLAGAGMGESVGSRIRGGRYTLNSTSVIRRGPYSIRTTASCTKLVGCRRFVV